MRRVRLLPKAREEIVSITAYLDSMGANPRKAFLSDLRKCLAVLGDEVVEYSLSRITALADKGYRSVYFGNYVLVYYLDGDDAIVAHVFHQRQDYARLVTGGER